MHGYGLSQAIHDRSDGVFDLDDGALYKGLHRLESRGWIESEWGLSENNRRARYYHLTARGRRQLREEMAAWRRYADAVDRVLAPA